MSSRRNHSASPGAGRRTTAQSDVEARQEWADELLDSLTPVMSALAILFLLVVFAESMTDPETTLSTVLTVASWLLWISLPGRVRFQAMGGS
ncbi:MAG: hypothetical protein ACLFWH_02590 [Actinomycetota bacterium]